MVEYKQIVNPYEFEEIANLFITEVTEISKDYPNILVEGGNKTLSDLEANSKAIRKTASSKKPIMNFNVFVRGLEMDIKSVNEVSVLITIHGRERKDVEEFESLTNKTATHFKGIRVNDNYIKNFDGPEGDFRYFLNIMYSFS